MRRDPADRMVEDYLRAVRAATAGLPAARRAELLAELDEHIREARALVADDDQVAGVREILDGLGTPEQIALAAYDQADIPPPSGRSAGQRAYDTVTVLLLMLGGLVPPVIGWVAGVAMLWAGPRWSAREKALGTLVWPLGPAGIGLVAGLMPSSTTGCSQLTPAGAPAAPPRCTTTGWSMPAWLGLPLLAGLIVSGVAVGLYLAARARRHDQTLLPQTGPA